ncbi:hypothetical protein [Endozoicomonas sp. ONNA1]|uniref:hypothetical protein n=1 Tax=Endozoicomonas sp. ONNA1 TaxID=2828740 RepID=UPI0021486C6F|nr:hypothetical protein [Endozoicomonas sp. ONNA1]
MLTNNLHVLDPNSAKAEFGVSLIDTEMHIIAILIELKHNPGMSITNAAYHYINEINHLYCLEPKSTCYIEIYENREDPCLILPKFKNDWCYSVSLKPIPDSLKEFVLSHLKAD